MSQRIGQRYRILAWGVAVAAHALVLALLVQSLPKPLAVFEPQAVNIELVPPPPAPEPPKPKPEPKPAPAPPKPSLAHRAAPAKPAARPIHMAVRAPVPEALPASPAPPVPAPTELSAAEVSGAMTAGAGSGTGGAGRACDMIRRLQDALRRDPRVLQAVDQAHRAAGGRGAAIMVWDGDWVRSGSEEGKGLASVRQAIAVGVAFAPEACRAEPVSGLVLISLTDAPGAAKLALGARRWRWSDLLFAR